MENMKTPFMGIIKDVKGRSACYKQDWVIALCSGIRYSLGCFQQLTTLLILGHKSFSFSDLVPFNVFQDISSNYVHFLCLCSSCSSLRGATKQRDRYMVILFISCNWQKLWKPATMRLRNCFISKYGYLTCILFWVVFEWAWKFCLFILDGSLSAVETLASTALCGVIHSIFGGQPLLILGVAEPTIIMYTYLYNFSKGRPELGTGLYIAWAGWYGNKSPLKNKYKLIIRYI